MHVEKRAASLISLLYPRQERSVLEIQKEGKELKVKRTGKKRRTGQKKGEKRKASIHCIDQDVYCVL